MKPYPLLSLFLTLTLLFTSQASFACLDRPCDLAQITEAIQSQQKLHKFSQEKTIKVLAKPLNSSGYLLLADNESVVWQTLKPIKSTTVISSSELQQFNKNDQPITLPANGNTQTSQLISSTFLSILSGDLNSLNDNFEVDLVCNDSGWDINLSPINPRIKRLIKHISIDGSDQIEQLYFTEANDDVTRIKFSAATEPSTEKQLGSYLVD